MSAPRVFLYVQHLLGIGHLKRAMTLATALNAGGLEVTLASGGFEVPAITARGVRVVQLPSVTAADLTFKRLSDRFGRPIDAEWKYARCAALLAAYHATDPQVLLIELFPFGRRQMRFELLPLLEMADAANPRPLIVSSVRDIGGGGQRDLQRQQETVDLVERYFDCVLVHGDPALIAFERTFPLASQIADRIHYTGYIVDRSDHGVDQAGAGEVLVSAGGGAVGRALLEAATRARPLTVLANRTWRLITGINASATDTAMIVALADRIGEGRVVVERMRSDFTTLLKNCAVSVSQAGYNTIMEVLAVKARAVVVPFAGATETEQMLRASTLASRGHVQMVAESELTPESLAAAIDRTAFGSLSPATAIDLKGAETSARVLITLLAERLQ
jgi:predicted glycosyltransferase